MPTTSIKMDGLVPTKPPSAVADRDATAEDERGAGPEPERRRPRRWRAIPVLSALCVAALVATQVWRMSASDGVGLEATASRSGRFSTGIQAIANPSRSSYSFAHEFATKTAYWDQRAERSAGRELLEAPGGRRPRVFRPEWQLVQTQVVARHGIRFPTSGNIRNILALLDKLGSFSSTLPAWMQNYSLPYNMSVEGELAAAGMREMRRLAARSLRTMGQLNPIMYSADKFQLAHTTVRRTAESAAAFAGSYFSNPQDVHFIEYPEKNDTLLRFFDQCPRYQREVKQNHSALAQEAAFKNSSLVVSEAAKMKHTLGLTGSNMTLDSKDLSSIYTACAFDYALYNITDKWCSLMTPSFVATMDYLDDLHEFYLIGGGYEINYDMAALLLRELFSNMAAAASGETALQGLFFFAHAETTLPLMTLMGLSDRTPLLANYSANDIKRRLFRTSRLAPFAANVEVRLHRRGTNSTVHIVEVLVNGQQRIIPGCGRAFCPLEWLEKHWRFYLDQYDFRQDCM